MILNLLILKSMRKIAQLLLLFIFTFNLTFSKAANDGKDSLAYSDNYFNEDFILHIDSMLNILQLKEFSIVNYPNIEKKYNFSVDSVPIYPILTYEYRLAKINQNSPIRLSYNQQVQNFIDLYTVRKRRLFSTIIGRSKYYFPLFEQELEKNDLPQELKYLAVIESALNPQAKSPSGAVGLWQFMYSTGKIFDLKINSFVDERKDPIKSTKAACDYLKYLYRTFNDWELAIAAYNSGPGVIRNAIEKSGGITDFWELQKYLPKQTQSYVPAFIAVNYAFNYIQEHNIVENSFDYNYFEIDTIIGVSGIYLSDISRKIDVPIKTMKLLNPEYKRLYIPKNSDKNVLVVPKLKKAIFTKKFLNQNKEFSKTTYGELPSSEEIKEGRVKIVHTVKHGEYFHQLALEYNCTINNIKDWNNLTSNNIYSNQKLVIYVEDK